MVTFGMLCLQEKYPQSSHVIWKRQKLALQFRSHSADEPLLTLSLSLQRALNVQKNYITKGVNKLLAPIYLFSFCISITSIMHAVMFFPQMFFLCGAFPDN